MVQTGSVEVPLLCLAPCPDVVLEGDLAFGVIAVETEGSRTISVINRGSRPAEFKLEPDGDLPVKLSVSQGVVDAHSRLDVAVTMADFGTGQHSGEITLAVEGVGTSHKVRLSATAVKPSYEIIGKDGIIISKVRIVVMTSNNRWRMQCL